MSKMWQSPSSRRLIIAPILLIFLLIPLFGALGFEANGISGHQDLNLNSAQLKPLCGIQVEILMSRDSIRLKPQGAKEGDYKVYQENWGDYQSTAGR